MGQIITRGFGLQSVIITRGYGAVVTELREYDAVCIDMVESECLYHRVASESIATSVEQLLLDCEVKCDHA